MNKYLTKLHQISQKSERFIVGLMSGTSLDGLDIALCRITGEGEDTEIDVKHFWTVDYHQKLRERLASVQSKEQTPTRELTRLHTELAHLHAGEILKALESAGISSEQIDLIASHGQTIYHAPAQTEDEMNATFQAVDGDHIAQKTGIITISDFRQKHTAVGGEGAPLAGIFDEVLYRDEHVHRLLLNLGGIANFTWLPSKESGESPLTADTGPANTLINEAMQKHYSKPFDDGGAVAASGTVHSELVRYVLLEPYFMKKFPKTTGQEDFRLSYIENLMESHGIELSREDLIASLTAITSQSISRAIDTIVGAQPFECYVSGGGVHNKTILEDLRIRNSRGSFDAFEKLGMSADAKEAAMMAFFANELVAGEGFIIPGVTTEKVHLGKISLPN